MTFREHITRGPDACASYGQSYGQLEHLCVALRHLQHPQDQVMILRLKLITWITRLTRTT